jgi:hypothetical protein
MCVNLTAALDLELRRCDKAMDGVVKSLLRCDVRGLTLSLFPVFQTDLIIQILMSKTLVIFNNVAQALTNSLFVLFS